MGIKLRSAAIDGPRILGPSIIAHMQAHPRQGEVSQCLRHIEWAIHNGRLHAWAGFAACATSELFEISDTSTSTSSLELVIARSHTVACSHWPMHAPVARRGASLLRPLLSVQTKLFWRCGRAVARISFEAHITDRCKARSGLACTAAAWGLGGQGDAKFLSAFREALHWN